VTMAGYLLGEAFGDVLDKYFLAIVFVIIVVSLLPAFIHLWRTERHEIFAFVKARILRRPAAGKSTSADKKDEPGA